MSEQTFNPGDRVRVKPGATFHAGTVGVVAPLHVRTQQPGAVWVAGIGGVLRDLTWFWLEELELVAAAGDAPITDADRLKWVLQTQGLMHLSAGIIDVHIQSDRRKGIQR
jgi:hypothetical protein